MLPKRLRKMGITSTENSEWKCCFCLHVYTATLLLGIWHLVMQMAALSVLIMLMREQHSLQLPNQNLVINNVNDDGEHNFLPTPLSKVRGNNVVDDPYYLATMQDGHSLYTADVDMGTLVTLCTFIITILMLYGTVKYKAVHLLPFFCLQLFDLAITTMTATGYFCYLRSIHRLIAEHFHTFPFKDEVLKLNPQLLAVLVLIAFIICLGLKAYFIGVVWRCYKYITLRKQINRNRLPPFIVQANLGQNHGFTEADIEQGNNITSIVVDDLKQTPPPSYQDVVDELPPPYRSEAEGEAQPTTATTNINNNNEDTVAANPNNPK